MALTIVTCADMIRQTLDQELAPNIVVPDLVDETGRWLFSHSWSWTSRQATLGVTATQNYTSLLSLPAYKIRDVFYTSSQAYWLTPTDIDEIVARRATSLTNGQAQFWATHWRDDSNNVPYPTLEFETTWQITNPTGLTVVYSKAWESVTAYVPIPANFEGLFIHALRAVARGYMEEDVASVPTRLEAIEQTSMFKNLQVMDTSLQLRHGPLRGGGVQRQMYQLPWPNYPRVSVP